jgi:signal transduction histidine kinase
MIPDQPLLLITRDHALAERVAGEALAGRDEPAITCRLEQARERLRTVFPAVILLDDRVVAAAAPLAEWAEELAAFAPVIVLAAAERQADLAELVAGGRVDVVVRSGGFFPVLRALLHRRLRLSEESSAHPLPASFLETLRHDVNNPLTGILGNAEMLLARREQLPAATAQRLETIAELALRVRDSVRRLAWAWEDSRDAARTA